MRGTVETGTSSPELLECSLYAEFDVWMPPFEWCPLADIDPPVHVQDQRFVGDSCVIDARVSDADDGGQVVRLKQKCDRRCPSQVLTDHGYMPQIKEMHSDRVVIGVHLKDHRAVTDIVEKLRMVAERVDLRQLSQTGTDDPVDTSVLDLTHLTAKQRETVTVAVSSGYYEQPRKASISDIARELGISPAAVSKRLAAVESKVMKDVFKSQHTSGQRS